MLDYSACDSAEFQNHNAIRCTYSRFYALTRRYIPVSDFTAAQRERERKRERERGTEREKNERDDRTTERERNRGKKNTFFFRVNALMRDTRCYTACKAGENVEIFLKSVTEQEEC